MKLVSKSGDGEIDNKLLLQEGDNLLSYIFIFKHCFIYSLKTLNSSQILL